MALQDTFIGARLSSLPKITVDLGFGSKLSAGLLLPAVQGIADGTSNTIMFGERQSASNIWGAPHILKNGFGLLLPAVARHSFPTGGQLPTLKILPYIEQNNRLGGKRQVTGLKLTGAKVSRTDSNRDGFIAWIRHQGIIAILIAL